MRVIICCTNSDARIEGFKVVAGSKQLLLDDSLFLGGDGGGCWWHFSKFTTNAHMYVCIVVVCLYFHATSINEFSLVKYLFVCCF